MCDQANHDNCEIVYDLQLEIDGLKITVKDLVDEKLELQQKVIELKSELWKRDSLNSGNNEMPEGLY